jgi:hypothetical protein
VLAGDRLHLHSLLRQLCGGLHYRRGLFRRNYAFDLGHRRRGTSVCIDYIRVYHDHADYVHVYQDRAYSKKAKCLVDFCFYFRYTRYSGAMLCKLTLYRSSTTRLGRIGYTSTASTTCAPHRLHLRLVESGPLHRLHHRRVDSGPPHQLHVRHVDSGPMRRI